MHPLIILPTYNERENLPGIVPEILGQHISGLRILIVDDNSPDGTGQIADALASRHPEVRVLHRPAKEGLGRAYLAGFQLALADPSVDYILEMDADFSHQPRYLPGLLAAAGDADLVLGSRYVRGGGVENWDRFRRFISTTANAIIRLMLGVPVRDLTGGFKCFRRQTLEALDLRQVDSQGYNFQIELTYKVFRQGKRIVEVPITFVERRAGVSKFNIAIMLESFFKVMKLRFSRQ